MMVLFQADVPIGPDTGEHEALELRDKSNQYFGKSVQLQILSNVNDIIAPALIETVHYFMNISINV